jgi:hypothetical protein
MKTDDDDDDAFIQVPPSIPLSQGAAAETLVPSTSDDDHKRRILEAAQSYLVGFSPTLLAYHILKMIYFILTYLFLLS